MTFHHKIQSLRLSHSSLGLLHSCPRKLEFRKFYLHPARDDSTEAGAGRAIHSGYQEYLKSQDRDMAAFEMMMNYPFSLNAEEDHDRSVYATYATLNALIDAAPLVEYEVATLNVDDKELAAIEVPFEFEIENFNLSEQEGEYIPVTYVGKIDAVLFNRASGEYGVFDIKTHRRKLNDLTPMYMFDEQCIPYALVIERLLGHELESITARYIAAYVDILNPKIGIYPFPKTREAIEDWAKGLAVDLQQIKMFYNAGWFRRNSNACLNFNRKCSFIDLCHSRDAETIQNIILAGSEGEPEKADHFGEPWVKMKLDLGF